MSEATQFRWEQDGAGGGHGTATYFVGRSHEFTLTVATFKDAHDVQLCIQAGIDYARWTARRDLLAQIGRIEP